MRQFVSDRLEEAKNLKELSNGNGEEEPASKRKRVELKVFKKVFLEIVFTILSSFFRMNRFEFWMLYPQVVSGLYALLKKFLTLDIFVRMIFLITRWRLLIGM